MNGKHWRFLHCLWLCSLCFYASSTAAQSLTADVNVCKVNGTRIVELSYPLSIPIKQGSNTFYFDCEVQSTSVFTLPVIGIDSTLVRINGSPSAESIPSSKNSFLITPGHQLINVELFSDRSRNIKVQLSNIVDFHSSNMSHNTVMSLYTGLCIALAIYVGFLGRGLRNTGLYAYSVYLISLAIFFGIQEGLVNYYFPNLSFLNTAAAQLCFAGIVVFCATLFISRLLDFRLLINNILYKLLLGTAITILISGICVPLLPQSLEVLVSSFMGWATLSLVFAIFCVAAYAAINRVHTANIVLLALSTVLFGMIFRIWLVDLSEFLNRYALIASTAIESFLLAIAASEKVYYLEEEKSKAYHVATQDDLCAVMNRRGWSLAVQRKIEHYKKHSGLVVVHFIDLNDFKLINDNFGHSIGDKVLQTFAKIIRHQAREDDIVGRLGGDEFVIFSYALSESHAQRISQRFTDKLTNMTLSIGHHSIKLSASLGCITVAPEDAKLDTMLDQADRRMYEQKQGVSA